jgi:dTDP-4-dehydrorhamnose 3,5-epimerase
MNVEFDSSVGLVPQLMPRKAYEDERGHFEEMHSQVKTRFTIAQVNVSFSQRNVFRGLHWQVRPNELAKHVSVIYGRIEDVVVDLRQESKTFLKCATYLLSCESSLLVPSGFAHGFAVLSAEGALVSYAQDRLYEPKSERILSLFDTRIEIPWQLFKPNNATTVLAEKDAKALLIPWADRAMSDFF